jgi:hypothetical protein
MKRHIFETEYEPGQRVLIEGEIPGVITEICIFAAEPKLNTTSNGRIMTPNYRILYEVRWIHNGDSRKDYFDVFRLKAK